MRKRWRPNPLTVALIALVFLVSIGAMVFGFFQNKATTPPPKEIGVSNAVPVLTPQALEALGLKVEKAGAFTKTACDWYVPLTITNTSSLSTVNVTLKFFDKQLGEPYSKTLGMISKDDVQAPVGKTSTVEVEAPNIPDFKSFQASSTSNGVQAGNTIDAPYKAPCQVNVPVKVTNNLVVSLKIPGTPSPDAATPTAGPAKLLNASVKVYFYDKDPADSTKKIIGSAVGYIDNLAPGESRTVNVTATGIEESSHYEVFPDSITPAQPSK